MIPSFQGIRGLAVAAVLGLAVVLVAAPARAIDIQEVKSPGGITAWLVENHSIPLVAVNLAFRGGAASDPADRTGLANFLASMLDEGAGDLDSQAYKKKLEQLAVKLDFEVDRDKLTASLQTLTKNRDEAFRLLKLALSAPRFDAEPLDRVRGQIVQRLRRDAEDPETIASEAWMRSAFGEHPYARRTRGTVETVGKVTAADLRDLARRLLTRADLMIAVVGDIDAASLGRVLDDTFGVLPAERRMADVAEAQVRKGPSVRVVERNIPQSVIQFGQSGIKRSDPDFIPAYVMNFILGGGGFGSRLMEEVREKRGLTYSVHCSLFPLDRAGLILGSAATRNDRAAETLALIKSELERMAKEGPTAEELAEAKTYLTGSYALRFDTSTKIAGQLLSIQLDHLGIDYVKRRNALVEAVSLDDVKRMARRLLDPDALIFTVVGKPVGIKSMGAQG